MTTKPHQTPRRIGPECPALWIVGLIACVLLLAAIIMILVVGDAHSDTVTMTFVIPAGASETVDVPTIDSAIAIPTEIVFQPNEVPALRITNNDSVAHRAGPWVVGPGQSYTLRLEKPGEYRFDCSVDPQESVVITVLEQ